MSINKLLFLLHPRKIILRRGSGALGDNLMLSFLAREIKKASPALKVIIETERPELFMHNPYIDWVIKGKKLPFYIKTRYRIDRDSSTHILDQLAEKIPIRLSSYDKRLDFFPGENKPNDVLKALPSEFIVVCPVGKRSFAANRKEWGVEKFCKLIGLLQGLPVVQIGAPTDPLLKGVIDMRTAGYPIRTCAAIMQKSLAGVFLEGGFMHLANAVGKPSVIIYGGALRPEITGYTSHTNLAVKIDCGPCFTSDHPMDNCPTMACMQQITPALVHRRIMGIIA